MRPDRHATDGNMIAADEHYSDREDDEAEPDSASNVKKLHIARARKWREEE